MKTRMPLRLFAGIFGVLLLTFLVRRAGPAKLLESFATLGWGLALVIALGGASHLVKTWAWRLTLLDEKHQVSFMRMFGLRLASEAVGQLGGLAQMFGESLRVSLLSPTISVASGIASVTLDRALFVLSAAAVSIVGLVAVLVVLPLPHTISLYAGLFVITFLGAIVVTGVAVQKRWPVFSATAEILGRIRYFSGWLERKRSLIHSVENKLLDFYHHTPGAFWGSLALNLACHGAALLEVYLILWLMGTEISLFAALGIEALTKVVNIAGTFNPGNVGTYEGGNMLIVKIFGLSGAVGLTLAFTRRLRAISWAAVGGLWLIVLSKSRKPSNSDNSTQASIGVRQEPMSSPEPQKKSAAGNSHIAVILSNNLHEGVSPRSIPQVGALPVLLRAILGAQKAGAARILVVVNRLREPWVQHNLLKTGRLPGCVEWLEFSAGETSLPSLLSQLVRELEGHLVIVAGDRIYHPSLHQYVADWHGEGDALALVTGKQLVGMYALSLDLTLDLDKYCPPGADTLDELDARLASTLLVRCQSVPGDMWQRVVTSQQRLSAEHKLDQWLVKPTDGIFARFNRRISVPISRQIIRFPITPNMVTLFTLAVSFISGVFFALGGYWNMLAGAILSVFASILDGCDGEVARLKLQESNFGCWLETICDYLYYLFIFTGMTIGLVRNSGNRTYFIWGGFLVFGAIASFLTIGLQRRHLATERPEQYLGIWHKEADNRLSNPLLFLGRHTEFMIRRCFLPYAFFCFALCRVVDWAFIGATVGANVVWIIALYSCLAFVPVPASNAPSGAS